MTVKEAAELANVSERLVYMAKELFATGRQDLVDRIVAGTLTVHAALKIAKPEKYGTKAPGLKALKQAWSNGTDADRDAFLEWLDGSE